MKRSFKDYFVIGLKGLAMGAADVVPGVSGGTIAFISGIYNELIDSINEFNFSKIKMLKTDGLQATFKAVNGYFLLSLFTGIGISVLSLAKLFKYLLETHPILVWAFFFGLVLASILFIAKQITKWNTINIILLLIGVGVAYYITIIPAMGSVNNSPLFLILAGALAICAMILPGISGAFILLLLGAYKPALDAIHNHDIKKIAFLAIGAIVGLLSFAKVLKWLFNHYKNATLAILTGFVIGSLNKIWPWKKVLKTVIIDGKTKILQEKSISPFVVENNHLMIAILLAVIGFSLIIILEKLGNNKEVNQ
jgi:putative membrane protein